MVTWVFCCLGSLMQSGLKRRNMAVIGLIGMKNQPSGNTTGNTNLDLGPPSRGPSARRRLVGDLHSHQIFFVFPYCLDYYDPMNRYESYDSCDSIESEES